MTMRSLLLILAAALAGLLPLQASATDWSAAGTSGVQRLYPYTDLPGVKAQADKKDEEQYACHTETGHIRRQGDWIFRSGGMPTIVYVCDRDGLVTQGTQVPLRGHYQPVR
ncbi:hypothetical protein AB4Z25_06745 [Rhizobium sp. RAF36]|uniref:hypothetical protein n=1 Tax=Rhizobium sp. RAF36 TaxID=3233055 RepID=UPI000DD635A2